jgi:hypothetical protein
LSSADIQWPDLDRLYNIEHLINKENLKNKYLNENPLIASFYFNEKVNYFIQNILKEKFKIKDYWYRIEFQHRGSPHIHGVFWLEGLEDLTKIKPNDFEKINKTKLFFDNLIECIQPDLNANYIEHPSKYRLSEVNNRENDLSCLVKAVQIHKCRLNYCKNNTKKICRFKFPKSIETDSKLEFNEKGILTYTPKRNSPSINCYNKFILENWRANMDIQPITSAHSLIAYIAKYTSKSEVKSTYYKSFFKELINKTNENESIKKLIQKLLLKLVSERDYSAQEVFYLLMGWNLFNCSRVFININIGNEIWLPIKIKDDNLTITKDSIDKYQNRPEKFENTSFYEFFSQYYLVNNNYSKRRLPAILNIFPFIKFKPKETNEEYYRQNIMIHTSWRNLNELNPLNKLWKDIYKKLNLNSYLNNEQHYLEKDNELINQINNPELNNENNQNELTTISTFLPNNFNKEINIDNNIIGQRTVDKTFNWFETFDKYKKYPNLINFIEFHKKNSQINNNESENHQINEINLSNKQKNVIEILESQLDYIENKKNKPKHQIVWIQGSAGTGKSTLINLIKNKLRVKNEKRNYKIMATTGVSAIPINGQTIHTCLSIRIFFNKPEYKQLTGQSLKNFQKEFENINFIIIDEISMCGAGLFKIIDLRLREAKGNNIPFGGLYVYIFGDINQLPPQGVSPIFTEKEEYDTDLEADGKLLFRKYIKKFIFLDQIFRQNSSEIKFIELLNRLAIGETTYEDYLLLHTRLISNNLKEIPSFKNAIRIYSTKDKVKEYNDKNLIENNNPSIKIESINNNLTAKRSSEDDADLDYSLNLSINSKIMLRHNYWVECGLANGSIGSIIDIILDPKNKDQFPIAIICKFESYTGPTLDNGGVPISPITKYWSKNGVKCQRTQYPIQLFNAINIHKTQGLTIKDKGVIDIGEKEFQIGLSYVAISRFTRLENILFSNLYSFERFKKIGESETIKKRKIAIEYMKKFQ